MKCLQEKCQDMGGPTLWPPPGIVERHSLNLLLWLPLLQVVVRVRNPPRRLCKDGWGEANSFATVSIIQFSKEFIVEIPLLKHLVIQMF